MKHDKQECPFCCEEININAVKCPECGEPLLKPCPYCGETIKTIAIKCKHCGAMLDSTVEIQGDNNSYINVKNEEYRCDFCKQIIPANAKKCPHCGEWLVDEPEEESCGMWMNNGVVKFINIMGILFSIIACFIGLVSYGIDGFYIALLISVVIYIFGFISGYIGFLPAIIAKSRNHPQFWPIFIINFLFGATVIFWIIVLIWATTHRQGRHTHW